MNHGQTVNKKKSLRSSAMLTLTALIWGVAFVAQSEGMNHVGAFTFNACRFLVGGLVLIPCIFLLRKVNGDQWGSMGREEQLRQRRMGIIGGVCCGIFICAGSTLQQFGIAQTTVGKAGFITSLYIIIVPILGLFLRKKVGLNIWASVAIAAAGMYLLCVTEGFSISRGDFLVFLCAIGFSLHILVIDYFSPKADGVVISCVQFFTAGIISSVFMFLFERPTWDAVMAAWAPVLYAGVMSCGVGYTLQVVAQKDVEPTVASLIMSLESVFSVLAGWLLLGQKMSPKELAGCVLVFGAIILAQIPARAFAGIMPGRTARRNDG